MSSASLTTSTSTAASSSTTSTSDVLTLEGCTSNVIKVPEGSGIPPSTRELQHYRLFRTSSPVPSKTRHKGNLYYFEVTVLKGKDNILVGLCTKSMRAGVLGWRRTGLAFKPKNGRFLCASRKGRVYGLPMENGDVLGCVVDMTRRLTFFAVNGIRFPNYTLWTTGEVFPAITVLFKDAHVIFNLGSSPFKYDPVQLQRQKPIPKFLPYVVNDADMYPDVCIKFKDESEPPILAHRVILSARSIEFAMKFEKLKKRHFHTICVDAEPVLFRAMLNFIYTGRIEINSREMAVKLSELASSYSVESLIILCNEMFSAGFFKVWPSSQINAGSLGRINVSNLCSVVENLKPMERLNVSLCCKYLYTHVYPTVSAKFYTRALNFFKSAPFEDACDIGKLFLDAFDEEQQPYNISTRAMDIIRSEVPVVRDPCKRSLKFSWMSVQQQASLSTLLAQWQYFKRTSTHMSLQFQDLQMSRDLCNLVSNPFLSDLDFRAKETGTHSALIVAKAHRVILSEFSEHWHSMLRKLESHPPALPQVTPSSTSESPPPMCGELSASSEQLSTNLQAMGKEIHSPESTSQLTSSTETALVPKSSESSPSTSVIDETQTPKIPDHPLTPPTPPVITASQTTTSVTPNALSTSPALDPTLNTASRSTTTFKSTTPVSATTPLKQTDVDRAKKNFSSQPFVSVIVGDPAIFNKFAMGSYLRFLYSGRNFEKVFYNASTHEKYSHSSRANQVLALLDLAEALADYYLVDRCFRFLINECISLSAVGLLWELAEKFYTHICLAQSSIQTMKTFVVEHISELQKNADIISSWPNSLVLALPETFRNQLELKLQVHKGTVEDSTVTEIKELLRQSESNPKSPGVPERILSLMVISHHNHLEEIRDQFIQWILSHPHCYKDLDDLKRRGVTPDMQEVITEKFRTLAESSHSDTIKHTECQVCSAKFSFTKHRNTCETCKKVICKSCLVTTVLPWNPSQKRECCVSCHKITTLLSNTTPSGS
ncbi:Ran-binding protein 9/10 [Pelomyxa schiedti]|nr:Ran-binding protein 9/10 [Pelomyxa schiedti]